LVSGPSTTMARFDPMTRTVAADLMPATVKDGGEAISADGLWVTFTRGPAGQRELWVRSVATGATERIAGGRCDNGEPAWELDSSAVVFASDCGRAYGLPALYRVPVAGWQITSRVN
jgi:Tol biopolymer transport system component